MTPERRSRAVATPGAAPTPTPSTTPLPTPTPRVDAVKPFLAAIGSLTFAASTTLTGTLSVGAASYPITGADDIPFLVTVDLP